MRAIPLDSVCARLLWPLTNLSCALNPSGRFVLARLRPRDRHRCRAQLDRYYYFLCLYSGSCLHLVSLGLIAALEVRSATRERGYDIYPRVCEPCVCVSESSWILAVSIPTQFLPSPQTITRRRLRSLSPLIKHRAFQLSKNRKTYTGTASLSPSLALLLTQAPSQVLHPPLPRAITNCISWLRSSRYAAN